MRTSGPDDGALSAAERQGIVDQQEATLEAMERSATAQRPSTRGIVTVSRLLAGYGLARVGTGLALTVAPTFAARPWLGPPAAEPSMRVTVRLLGVRDALLGAATVGAAYRWQSPTGWALAGAAADAADLVATAANRSRLPRSARIVAAVAGGSTGAALALALTSNWLRRPRFGSGPP